MRACTSVSALAVLVVLAAAAPAQSRPLFDQDNVEHLAALSSPGFEAKPDISGDRLTLYYASDQPGGVGDLDLWVAQRPDVNSPFGPQSNIVALNSGGRDHTPTTSADGLLMIFSSNRPGGLGTDDAWMSTRPDTSSPWGPPVHIPELSSTARDMGFTITGDALTIYFTSNRTLVGDFDIFTSTRPDRSSLWAPPTVVTEISHVAWEDKFPSVTADNLTMYFASNRPGGVKDPTGVPSDDIWVAMRPDVNSPWSTVENLWEINTEHVEYLMSIADDGSELFFVSDRPGVLGIFDLFRVPALRGVTRYGAGTVGEAGIPRVRPFGEPRLGTPGWGYEITNVATYAFGFFVHSLAPAPGPFHVDLATATPVVFQLASTLNPPPSSPRTFRFPLGVDPSIVGRSSYWQVIMWVDLFGQASFAGVPFSASPGLQVTFFQ